MAECCDFESINSMFFLSKSQKIGFATICPVNNRKAETMKKESTRLINKYTKQGLKVNEIFADNKFHPIIDANALIHVNLAAAGEHVGDIKNPNKVLQEHMRCICHTLPYSLCWPRVMVITLAEYMTQMFNAFPSKTGAYQSIYHRRRLSFIGPKQTHPSFWNIRPTDHQFKFPNKYSQTAHS